MRLIPRKKYRKDPRIGVSQTRPVQPIAARTSLLVSTTWAETIEASATWSAPTSNCQVVADMAEGYGGRREERREKRDERRGDNLEEPVTLSAAKGRNPTDGSAPSPSAQGDSSRFSLLSSLFSLLEPFCSMHPSWPDRSRLEALAGQLPDLIRFGTS